MSRTAATPHTFVMLTLLSKKLSHSSLVILIFGLRGCCLVIQELRIGALVVVVELCRVQGVGASKRVIDLSLTVLTRA